MRHTEALILTGKIEEAIPHIQNIKKNTDRIYQVSCLVLEGMVAEREKDDKKANIAYLNALKMPLDERYTKHFQAYAWAGLARIANRKDDITQAKSYYKKCLEIAEYKSVTTEAENYLNKN
jgi:tetratricopeptide (TPR) repeat protein